MRVHTAVRLHWFCLLVALAALLSAVGFLSAACGSSADAVTTETVVRSSTTQTTQATTTSVTSAATSSTAVSSSDVGVSLFDSSLVHEIAISFAQEDYDAMIETYKSEGVKDWIKAMVTIDGVTYTDVGLRLKGNSSIMGLREGGRTGGPISNSSADEPEGLPWLIRLDEYVDGQNHDGIVDLVVRSNTSVTALNEAVSLGLLDMAGLESLRAIAVRFSVNGSHEVLRLATELPNDLWMEQHLDSGGALYKAESTGDYTYRGEEPESYEEVFDQEAGKDNTDLTPLIEFLDFINNADDATFNAELADRLDIDGFGTYLAMEELLANFDDIDGPGNNSYLYYDADSGMFAVVPWDHNLAFGGTNGGGGGGRGAGEGAANGWGGANGGGAGNGGGPAGGGGGTNGGPAGGRGGKSNILVERFHANPEFEALYEQKLVELTAQLYESGAAADVLAEWVTLLKTQASDLVDASTVDQEAAKIEEFFTGLESATP